VIVLRPGIVWGVRSSHTLHIAQSLATKSAYLVDEGRGVFNGIYIDNLTACIRACHQHPQRAPGFYNVGDAEVITWRQFFDAFGPSLQCETSRLPRVAGERFPWSTKSVVDAVQSMGLVNASYHRFKKHIPDGIKAQIRRRLEGAYNYERYATEYLVSPTVDREMWHLQRTGHKLPIQKFARTFDFATPVTFTEGVRRTLCWLTALGLASAPASAVA
jgi:nucleoside-diphosphate-sugar epimerase